MTTSSFAGEGIVLSPGARACTLDGRRPASRCPFSCSAVTVDPAQSAEIDLFAGAGATAAPLEAMSMTLLDEEPLALEAPLVRLGAMVCVRSERGVLRGKEMSAGEKENFGVKGTSEAHILALRHL